MRYGRILVDGAPRFARLEGDAHLLGHLLTKAPWDGGTETGEKVDAPQLLAPVVPSKLVCIGRNYKAHADELGHDVPKVPLIFLKPPSALLEPNGTIRLPAQSTRVEHEGELVVVLGQRLKHATEDEAVSAIFGVTAANDVTARDLQRSDVQFTRGKSFDTFCPLGPFIDTESPLAPRSVRTRVNGELRQDGRTEHMIFSIPTLLAFVSSVMTLEPGDVLLTGTPAGVGPLVPGDEVEVDIEGLAPLRSQVAAETR